MQQVPVEERVEITKDSSLTFFKGKVYKDKTDAKTAIVDFCVENSILAVFPYSDENRIEARCVGKVQEIFYFRNLLGVQLKSYLHGKKSYKDIPFFALI